MPAYCSEHIGEGVILQSSLAVNGVVSVAPSSPDNKCKVEDCEEDAAYLTSINPK